MYVGAYETSSSEKFYNMRFLAMFITTVCLLFLLKLTTIPGGGGGWGGIPLYRLYRYVRPQRVGFFSCFGHK